MKTLSSYPDYAKAPPSYVMAIIEAFGTYDVAIQEKLAAGTGLVAHCKFLPTVADVVELGNTYASREARLDRFDASKREALEPKSKLTPEQHAHVQKTLRSLKGIPDEPIRDAATEFQWDYSKPWMVDNGPSPQLLEVMRQMDEEGLRLF